MMAKKYFSSNRKDFALLEFFENFIGEKENNKKTLTGFSLIELLVVIFIVSLLSGSVIAGYFTGQKRSAVSRAVQLLAADLRRVQNFALTGATQGATVPAGYGLYLESTSQYKLFYNTTSDKQYVGGSVVLETILLADAAISSEGVTKNIYFTPPEPVTYINGTASGSQVFTVTSGSYSKTVTVDASGRISID